MKLTVPFAFTPKLTSEARYMMPASLEPRLIDQIELEISVLPAPPALTVKLDKVGTRSITYRNDDNTWRRPLGFGRYGQTEAFTLENLIHLATHGYVPSVETDNLWGSVSLAPCPDITNARNSELMIGMIETQRPNGTFQKPDKRDCIDYESSKKAAEKLWGSLNLAIYEETGQIWYEVTEPVLVLAKRAINGNDFELVPSNSRMVLEAKPRNVFAYDDWSGVVKAMSEKGFCYGSVKNPLIVEVNEVPKLFMR